MSKLIWPTKKYSGAGNVFLLIDDRSGAFPTSDIPLIQSLCQDGLVDGLLLLQQKQSRLRMRIFNLDGSEASSCGNGLRCMAQYILDQNIASDHQIWMHDRWVSFFYEADKVGVEMGFSKNLRLNILTEKGPVHFVDTGVPHAVQFLEDPSNVDLLSFGSWLRHHSLFQPAGANVSVAKILPDGKIQARTFERGVEGETLACGTGALAIATIASALFGFKNVHHIQYAGGDLLVQTSPEGALTLLGKAHLVT